MPDGTSLIFDSKAFKLGEFSTVLARWHDLSEKDTERIVWFAASGGPWTIRAATILVPLGNKLTSYWEASRYSTTIDLTR